MSSRNSIFKSISNYYQDFIPIFLTVLFFFFIARSVEVIAVNQRHVLPEGAYVWAASLFWDIIFACFLSLFLLLIYSPLRWMSKNASLIATGFVLSILLWISAGLIGYYIETLLPLGADFYAYSFSEIQNTIQTSISIRI